MCGIAGILNLTNKRNISKNNILDMIMMLTHRGPDGHGMFVNGDVGLGHTRLSIIDLEGGQQPISNEHNDIYVVFNGEIFNYLELTSALKEAGHRFRTHSDTEVIVHLYEEYGDEFVHHLNGQFAIALWDQRHHRLILVRDRPGILPLFYTVKDKQLFFASEVKSILAGTRISPTLNAAALDEIMTFWAPVGSNTIFDTVESLEPGCMLIVDKGDITKKTYWQWSYPRDSEYSRDSDDDLIQELKELLINSTQIRLRSDVPVGAYLSGGLDSSSLVAIMKRHGNVPMRTFSVAFEDEGQMKALIKEK